MRYEMTDEQIINLFKYCNESDCNACYGCSAYQDGKCTVQDLCVQVSQVIDRQKAEIERLKTNIDGPNIFTTNHIKVIMLQAIKEFSERLKEAAYSYSDISGYRSIVVDADSIDNLIKEMTEVER